MIAGVTHAPVPAPDHKPLQTRSMEVPRESALAMHTLSKQQQDREEQQQLKQLVLKYERQEEAESRSAWVTDAGKKGYRIKFGQ